MTTTQHPSTMAARVAVADLTEIRVREPGRITAGWAARRRRPLVGTDGRMLVVAADHPARGALGVRSAVCAMASRSDLLARLVTALERPGVDGVLGTGLPVWCRGTAAPPSVAGLTFVGWQEPVACGGVAVFPDDIIVADDDGAVLIPAASLDGVLAEAPEQERMEAWIASEIEKGVPLPGLYPMNADTKARYEAAKRGG